MHHDIRTMRKGILNPRRPKRRIDKQQRTPRVRLFGVVLDIIRRSERVDRCFEMDDVAFPKVFGRAVEGEKLNACESRMDAENTMGSVVASSDGYLAGFEPGLQRESVEDSIM